MHVEANGIELCGSILGHAHLEVPVADNGGVAHHPKVAAHKYGLGIFGSVGLELGEQLPETGVDLMEVEVGIDIDLGFKVGLLEVLVYDYIESGSKLIQIFGVERQPGGKFVPAELHEHVFALFECVVHVESADAPCRSLHQAVDRAQHDGRTVVFVDQARCHDADHSKVPFGMV